MLFLGEGPILSNLAYVAFLDGILGLLFVFIVSWRWRNKLSRQKKSITSHTVLVFFLLGFAQWALYSLPMLMLLTPLPQPATFGLLMLCCIGMVLSYRFFFYFFPAILGLGSFKQILIIAHSYYLQDRSLAIKVLLAPFAIAMFFSHAVLVFYPDQRDTLTVFLSLALSGIFTVLATYLGLAASIVHLDDINWRQANLDPYRQDRLATVAFHSPKWLENQLVFKPALFTLLFAGMLILGNYFKAESMAPAAKLKIVDYSLSSIATEANKEAESDLKNRSKLKLTLDLNDSEYKFRGFSPSNFRLAGESGRIVAFSPSSIIFSGKSLDTADVLPRKEQLELTIEFETTRETQELSRLKDLYLYYRSYQWMKLDLKSEGKVG